MHILMILHELLAVMYVIITFVLVMYIFNKAQDESIYLEKYCYECFLCNVSLNFAKAYVQNGLS